MIAKPEEDEFDSLRDKLESKDWKTRYETIHAISAYTVKFKDKIKQDQRVEPIFACFAKGLMDSNLKVNIHSLSALLKIIPLYSRHLDRTLGPMTASLMSNLCSANSSIRLMSNDVFECLKEHCAIEELFSGLISSTS